MWALLKRPSPTAQTYALAPAPGGFWVGTTEGFFYFQDGSTSCDSSDDVITWMESEVELEGAIRQRQRHSAHSGAGPKPAVDDVFLGLSLGTTGLS